MSNNFINKLAVAFYRIPGVKDRWANNFNALESDTIPWTPLKKVIPLMVKSPFGHALGEPFNKKQQVTLFKECLEVLESAQKPGVIVDSPYREGRHQLN